MESKVVWTDGMAFEAHLDGHTFHIDADPSVGGQGLGPKPKGLTLTSLAGCTAMDVISMLTKMRQGVTRFEVCVDGGIADEHPRKFTTMTIRYEVDGEVEAERLARAVHLSEERYCGVSATLQPTVELRSEIVLNGAVVPDWRTLKGRA